MPKKKQKRSLLDLAKAAVTKAQAHPVVAILVATAAVFAVLANAGKAVEVGSNLWSKWATPTPILDATWQGVWGQPRGHTFSFVMRLAIQPDDSAAGEILWQLIDAPPDSFLAKRINEEATEFVSGTYDRATHTAVLEGVAVSDPTLIMKDSYKFVILPDKATFEAVTLGSQNRWNGMARGRVVVVPQRKK